MESTKGFIWEEYYVFKNKIGNGSFSRVYKGIHVKTKELVAIKKINKLKLTQNLIDKFINEIELIKSLEHPNIVQLKNHYINDKYIILILEYCNGGTLKNLVCKDLSENEIRPILYQIISGLHYLDKKGIIHRDLKPDNILIHNDTNVKIIDFGFSIRDTTENELHSTICGTPLYMSPELLLGQLYNKKTDLWSIGIIAYELFHNKNPYGNPKSISELTHKIKNNKILYKSDISFYYLDLLKKLLDINPNNRITYEDLLKHPWFFSKLATKENEDIFPMDDVNTIKYLTYSEILHNFSQNSFDFCDLKNNILADNNLDNDIINSSVNIKKIKYKKIKDINILDENTDIKDINTNNNINNKIEKEKNTEPININFIENFYNTPDIERSEYIVNLPKQTHTSDSFLNVSLKFLKTFINISSFNTPNSL